MIASCIILFLIIFNLGVALAKHGEYVTKKVNFFVQFITTIIQVVLFYYAGLFDCFFK